MIFLGRTHIPFHHTPPPWHPRQLRRITVLTKILDTPLEPRTRALRVPMTVVLIVRHMIQLIQKTLEVLSLLRPIVHDTSKTAKITWFILVLHWAVDVIEWPSGSGVLD